MNCLCYGCELHRCRRILGIANSEYWWHIFSQAALLDALQVPLYYCNRQDGSGHVHKLRSCNLDTSNMILMIHESVEALEAYQGKHREVLEGTILERLRLASNGRLQSRSVEQTIHTKWAYSSGDNGWSMLRWQRSRNS